MNYLLYYLIMAVANDKKRIPITFERELLEKVLAKDAKTSGKSISALVAEIVEQYYRERDFFSKAGASKNQ